MVIVHSQSFYRIFALLYRYTRMLRKNLFWASFLCLLFVTSYAQTAKYSNAFLSLGVGARGLAMSNSMVAISDDVHAAYWNPAGLARMNQKLQIAAMHSEYFAGISKYDYAGVAYKIDSNSSVAFTYIRFGVDNIMNTTELIDNQGNIDYDKISYFSSADNAFLLSYAYAFKKVKGLSVGGNAKIVRRRIGSFACAWGFGLDFGVQYERKGWQVGAHLQDATGTFNAWSYTLSDQVKEVFLQTGNEIPENALEVTVPQLLLGGAKYVDFGKGFNATFALNADFTFDGRRDNILSTNYFAFNPHFGMEFAYKKIVALRAGIGNFQQEVDFDNKKRTTCQINLGIGINIKDIVAIDYAFTDIGDVSAALYSHVISLRIGINSFKRKKSPKTTDQ